MSATAPLNSDKKTDVETATKPMTIGERSALIRVINTLAIMEKRNKLSELENTLKTYGKTFIDTTVAQHTKDKEEIKRLQEEIEKVRVLAEKCPKEAVNDIVALQKIPKEAYQARLTLINLTARLAAMQDSINKRPQFNSSSSEIEKMIQTLKNELAPADAEIAKINKQFHDSRKKAKPESDSSKERNKI